MINGVIALINGFSLCVCVLRKGKRKPASQDRNRYLRQGPWLQDFTRHRQKKKLSRCATSTVHPQLKTLQTGHYKRLIRAQLSSPEMLAFSSTFLRLPRCQRGNSPPCTATKPRLLFKTGCLSEASFPSNKQSAKPDFARQSGSTRVTLFPHPVSWSIWALRECGRPGAEKARGCGRNLRLCARFQGGR